jgi:putative heme-binding domain-containing protein
VSHPSIRIESPSWALPALVLTILPISLMAAVPVEEDYNQWKRALGTNAVTSAGHITALPGFTVELLQSAQAGEGSWVAMAFDPRGRLVIAREDRGLLRLTARSGSGNAAPAWSVETINTNLLECRGLLFAYDALYANANNSKGLYRLRDTNGDDRFDEVKLLKATPGGVGHGRNQLALGPDGMIYSIHGDDVGLPVDGVAPESPLRHYAEDRLLPCDWDKHLFNASAKMPFGHLIRTDRDGTKWELVAGGLRNPFGIDFNEAGDLFTFDADMEWDVGVPWYHPTRVLHLVPGGDYGWRRGTGVLPVWSPDTLSSAADIGLGSPTGVKFGARSNFPEPWRSALFVQDWAYGKIHAVHLRRLGASYSGTSEVFLHGRPLNVTGLDFGPDGAMYFVTGGRRTQSGLYRVSLTGAPISMSAPSSISARPTNSAAIRPAAVKEIWSRLDDSDPWVRYSARVKLENLPSGEWFERALTETSPTAGLTALIALSRAGEASLQPRILDRLAALSVFPLTSEQQLLAIRGAEVCFLRLGRPDAATAKRFTDLWEPHYPATDSRVSQSLCELLVYLGSTNVVRKTIPLLATAATQEEKLQYLFTLRLAKAGWTIGERRAYFDWLVRARKEFHGANSLPTTLNYIRAEVEAAMNPAERADVAELLTALDRPASAVAAPATERRFVKAWSMTDFAGDVAQLDRGRDTARGKKLFADVGCAQCHRVGSTGGIVGPDLTAVGSRFDARALLESIIEPSKVVAEMYRNVVLTTKAGVIWEGRIVSEDDKSVVIGTNPVDADARRRVAKADIASRRESQLSSMPEGLLNTLSRDEVLDLMAWLVAGGIPRPASSRQ